MADLQPAAGVNKYLPENADDRLRRAGNVVDGGRELCGRLVSEQLVARPELIDEHKFTSIK